MGKFIKQGRIVIVLAGRYAGRKAIVVKTSDEGDSKRNFGHCLVAGIDKYPMKVTKSMSNEKIIKRSRIKPFVKYINYTHIMPTRYSVNDIDVKSVVTPDVMEKGDTKESARKSLKQVFEKRYITRSKNTSGVKYLYSQLKF
jgi:large subunit ribosomal protein L27e